MKHLNYICIYVGCVWRIIASSRLTFGEGHPSLPPWPLLRSCCVQLTSSQVRFHPITSHLACCAPPTQPSLQINLKVDLNIPPLPHTPAPPQFGLQLQKKLCLVMQQCNVCPIVAELNYRSFSCFFIQNCQLG